MNAALLDIHKGMQAHKELGRYLNNVQQMWPMYKRGIFEVYEAMRGNEQGWKKYLKDLQIKGHNLGQLLGQLGTVIAHMTHMAAAASKRAPTRRSTWASPPP